jgi:hypothetical protein
VELASRAQSAFGPHAELHNRCLEARLLASHVAPTTLDQGQDNSSTSALDGVEVGIQVPLPQMAKKPEPQFPGQNVTPMLLLGVASSAICSGP